MDSVCDIPIQPMKSAYPDQNILVRARAAIYYESPNGEEYIYFIHHSGSNDTNFRYNISTDSLTCFTDFMTNSHSAAHTITTSFVACVNEDDHLLHFWACNGTHHVLNVIENKWSALEPAVDITNANELQQPYSAVCINGKRHILVVKYDQLSYLHGSANYFSQIDQNLVSSAVKYYSYGNQRSVSLQNIILLHLEAFNELIAVGYARYQGFYRTILVCSVDDKGVDGWRKHEIKMPYGITKGFGACIAFGYILFVFYYDHKCVWCCDMNDGEWYEKEGKLNIAQELDLIVAPTTYCIKTNKNIVHFITDTDAKSHVTLNLMDAIPKELLDKLRSRCILLISAYGRSSLGLEEIEPIPAELIQLIGQFYSQIME